MAKSGLNVPHFVLTGYYDKVSVFLPDDESIFRKNSDEVKLFNLIKEKFSSSDKNQVARKYPSATGFVENYFNNEEIKIFIELYKNDDLSRDVFADSRKLRILNEKTMDILGVHGGNLKDIDQLIDFIRDSGYEIKDGSRTINIIDFFNSKISLVPKCIEINVKSIYHTCSAVGSHSRKSASYVPTAFQIEAFKFQLLEIISWVINYLETKTK